MERVKNAGGNITNGYWGEQTVGDEDTEVVVEEVAEIKMTNDEVKNTIALDDLKQHDKDDNPWFVVKGEVYDGTPFLKEHPGGGQSIISAAATDCTDEFMAIRKLWRTKA